MATKTVAVRTKAVEKTIGKVDGNILVAVQPHSWVEFNHQEKANARVMVAQLESSDPGLIIEILSTTQMEQGYRTILNVIFDDEPVRDTLTLTDPPEQLPVVTVGDEAEEDQDDFPWIDTEDLDTEDDEEDSEFQDDDDE